VKIGPSRCVLYSFFCHYCPLCTAPSVDDYAAAHVVFVHVAADRSPSSRPCVLALDPRHESTRCTIADSESNDAMHAQLNNNIPVATAHVVTFRCRTSTTVSAVLSTRLYCTV
jgi:hypothetical protein